MGYTRQHQRGGGLLSKLLGQVKQTGARQSFNPYGFGVQQGLQGRGLLKSLTDPSTINHILTNTQKVLNTAGQVGPLVQQYGPIVKNLPMMWKLYRGLKDAPEFNENSDPSNSGSTDDPLVPSPSNSSGEEAGGSAAKNKISPSRPKLYI